MSPFGRKRYRQRQQAAQRAIHLRHQLGIKFGRSMFEWGCDYPRFDKPDDDPLEIAWRRGCEAGWVSEAWLFEDERLGPEVERGLVMFEQLLARPWPADDGPLDIHGGAG